MHLNRIWKAVMSTVERLFQQYSSRAILVLWMEEEKVSSRSATEKAMAPHSSTLAWKIPWTEQPVRLQSMGSRRVGHN